MATIKSFTDLQQSKKLAEFLPIESADMYIYKNVFFGALSCFNGTTQIGEYIKLTDKESKAYPCWSLAALLGLMPRIEHLKPFIDLSPKLNSEEVAIYYHSEDSPYIVRDNPIDACVAMIKKLHEQNLL